MDDTNGAEDIDADISELAVRGLNEASQKMRESGMPYAAVIDGALYEFDGKGGKEFIKMIPRISIAERIKYIKPKD